MDRDVNTDADSANTLIIFAYNNAKIWAIQLNNLWGSEEFISWHCYRYLFGHWTYNIGSVVGDLHRIQVSQGGDIFEILFAVKFEDLPLTHHSIQPYRWSSSLDV